jgi:phosphoribosylaminoimidazole-succinocarboxamide synthase
MVNTKVVKFAREKIYEGREKIFYSAEEEFAMVEFFKDSVRLPCGSFVDVSGKGVVRNSISAYLMQKLDMVGIDNHLIEKMNMREQLIQMVDMVPMQVSIAYLACGRYQTEFGLEAGYVFDKPMIDFSYKSPDKLLPIVNEAQLMNLCLLTQYEVETIKKVVIRAGDFLAGFFAASGIRLVEAKFELGKVFTGDEFIMMIADEISPDTCRLWDLNTNDKLDFEAIAQSPDDAVKIYKEVAKRIGVK